MEKIHKKLIIAFLILVGIKIILTLFISSPSIFADEYLYLKNARSFFHDSAFNIGGGYKPNYPPIYPATISAAYFFQDGELIYLLIKIINTILLTSIIFPAYFLAKEFLDQKDSLTAAILISLLPANFNYQHYIMSENLFYPLFLLCIYLLYKSFDTNNKKYFIITGLVTGITLLTRTLGIIIPIITIMILLIKKPGKEEIKNTIISLFITAIIYVPYAIYKQSLIKGYEVVIIDPTPSITSIPSFFIWLVFYTSILLLSTGIIGSLPIINNIKNLKDKYPLMTKIFYTTIVSTIILVSYYAARTGVKTGSIIPFLEGRPVGRYLDHILPLVIILAMLSIKKLKEGITKKQSVFIFLLLSVSTPVVFFQLFPLNNISTSWVGTIRYILNADTATTIILFIIIFLIITYLGHLIINKHHNKIVPCLFIFLILSNVLNFTIISKNAKDWEKSELFELGKWINKNIKGDVTFLIDKENCKDSNFKESDESFGPYPSCKWTKFGVWMNKEMIVENLDTEKKHEYIITKTELNKELVIQSGTTYLYKN